jgi:hypothetical protein
LAETRRRYLGEYFDTSAGAQTNDTDCQATSLAEQ